MNAGSDRQQAVWPRGRQTVQPVGLAPRLPSLAGKTVGHLWDDLFRGDQVFAMLEEELGRRFPGVRFVRWDAFGSTFGADEQEVVAALPQRLQQHGVDAVISGMAC